MNIREARDNYLLDIKHLGQRTQVDYRYKLRIFVEWCERQAPPLQLEQVNNSVFSLFLEHLRETHTSHKAGCDISTRTLAGYYRVIKAFLNFCLEDEEYAEFVRVVTVKRLKRPKVEEFLIQPFSLEQVEALLAACQKEMCERLQMRAQVIVMLLWKTGIRANELCTLRMVNVNLTRIDASITVMGKGLKERRLPLEKECRDLLHKYIRKYCEPTIVEHTQQALARFRGQKQRRPTEKEQTQIERTVRNEMTVFFSRVYKPMRVSGLEQLIHRLGDWASIEGVACTPHRFRHTCSRAFILNGGDIYELSKLLGHSSIITTEVYLKSLGVWDIVSRRTSRN